MSLVNLSLGLVDWSWYVNQRNNGSHQVVSCQFWWYDKSRFLSTTVTEWDIVCDRHWLRQLDTTFYMAGAIIGSSGMGWLADIFGRKNILLCNLFLMILCSLLAAFSPAFWFFLIMRFLIGIFCPGVYSIAYILGMEFVGASKRHLIGLIIGICFIVGHITLTGMAYVVREWRKLQLFIAVPPLGCLIYCWFIPESPRWLILKNRTVEAEKIIRKVSHINKVGLPKTIILITDSKNKSKTVILRKHTLLDLLKTPNLRRNTLTVFISWFSISCGYYGLALNTHNLSGEPYLNFLLTGLVEIPAAAFFFVIVDRLGRKRIILGTEVLAGVTCVAVAFIPDAFGWINVTLCLVGRFFISMAFGVMYLYSAEIFPTALRTTGIGCAQMFGRLGAIACQWVILLADFWRPSPFVTFGIMSFAAGVTSLFLPETLGRTLPETLEDGEKMV
ncbi:organic cation transporter protein-like isoform X2 [Polypterus senegalus]|uniref:organic cation transporter protein-like isoform X2 n=1 Tax=Polypterus senegalus TaxID=55291 RepID=UPI001963C43E|nr:organic cation transporter protein-like isoform X2 [Polypterus senegalus]